MVMVIGYEGLWKKVLGKPVRKTEVVGRVCVVHISSHGRSADSARSGKIGRVMMNWSRSL